MFRAITVLSLGPSLGLSLGLLLLSFGGSRGAVVSVDCKNDPASDASTISTATASSAVGDLVHIHGRCVVSETVRLLGQRAYRGDSRAGTVIVQANGSSLVAVVASDGYLRNFTWTDEPISIAHLTVDGNAAGNPGRPTAGLAVRAWFSTVDDVVVQNCLGDGLLIGAPAGNLHGNGPNSIYSNSWFRNNGGHGVNVEGDTTDTNFVNNWISDSGRSALYMRSAAGWQISGNHLYATSEHAIFAEACFATAIHDNYVEDFGRNNTDAPAGNASPTANASRYYGIGCRVQGGASTIISNNKVYRFPTQEQHGYKQAVFAYIGIDRVNYGVGVVNVLGNIVRRDNSTAFDIGLSYSVGGGAHGQQLELISANNLVHFGLPNGTGGTKRFLDPAVTVVAPL